ncbi:MAG: 16S rRNA (cytidine(1402)-2'-O)-methyltransferase [Burkholderiaceae bacterium]
MESKTAPWAENLLMQACGVAAQDLPAGALYVVALPIGNAADITLRALWTLARVDAIAAEDTRETRKLLDRFGITTPSFAAHEHNERAAAEKIVERLRAGERIALVTDAGTPAVSDPGARVVRVVLDAGLRVVPVPGASSSVTALSAAGLAPGGFAFVGFLPTGAKQREKQVRSQAARGEAFIVFEAPHRILALARELSQWLEPQRRVVFARELTKKFETFETVAVADLPAWGETHEARGEYVVLIDVLPALEAALEIDETTRRWLAVLADELPASRAAAVAAKVTGLPRDRLYRELSGRGAAD